MKELVSSEAVSVLPRFCLSILELVEKTEKKEERMFDFLLELDLLLVQDRPEALSTTLVESDCQLCSLTTLVFSACHFPSLLRSTDFFLTLWTLCHNIPFSSLDGANIKHFP